MISLEKSPLFFPNPSPPLEKQLETEGRYNKNYPYYEGLSSKRKPLGEPISVVSPQAGVPCNSRMIICLNSMKDPSFAEQIAYDQSNHLKCERSP